MSPIFSSSSVGRLARVAPAVMLALLPLAFCPAISAAADGQEEVRALWVQGSSLTTPNAIADMVRSARASAAATRISSVVWSRARRRS